DRRRVSSRSLDGIQDAEPTGPTHGDKVTCDTRLRDQIVERHIQVAVPVLSPILPVHLAATLAESTAIDGENVHAGRRQAARRAFPRFTCTIALVIEEHAGA